MSLEKLRDLRSTWRRDSDLSARLGESLGAIGFSDDYVDSLIARVTYSPRKPKQLKDNVWGMMEFDWRSMCLIDSPLLQRLRRIHQLGLSFLTYPTAEHSRFSHSLGVAHVTSRFVDAINKRANEYAHQPSDLQYVGFDQIPLVRPHHLVHAALLHDVDHLPYSHVSEKVLTGARTIFTVGNQSVADLLFDVNKALCPTLWAP